MFYTPNATTRSPEIAGRQRLLGSGAMTDSRAFAGPASKAPRLLDGGTGQALAGHGFETTLTGTTIVPDGTTVYVPPAGLELRESIGQAMAGGGKLRRIRK
jgi:hypothetical protein